MLAKKIRNKKTAAEFANHVPFASKNTTEKIAKNCYLAISDILCRSRKYFCILVRR